LSERTTRQRTGFTLVELVIVLALIGIGIGIVAANLSSYAENQRAGTSARAVADAFSLARAEAIRTGNQFIVAFDIEAGLGGISSDIVIVKDGTPAAADCEIDAGEVVETVSLERGVRWGTDPGLSNGAPAPDDAGGSGNQAGGSSFQDAHSPPADASWVMFAPDGMPHLFTEDGAAPCDEVSPVGDAGGAIYLTNGSRDYAVVLSALGIARLHRWNPDQGAWTE
jgi:prepilin-type N-terminal cleavage/methylation domain-containing protein